MMHWRYLSYVVRHKWFVFVAGLRTGAPLWRLLIHDWSKFLPSEWRAYATYFYASKPFADFGDARHWPGALGPADVERIMRERQDAFDVAWLKHQHRNPHHWQHWLLQEDDGDGKLVRMPDHFVREMVADWMGAGRAITGKWDVREWYAKNRTTIELHPDSRQLAEALL